MHQWMERQRKKWEVTMRGKAKRCEGTKKTKGSEGNKMEERERGGKTGRRLCMDQLVEKRWKRIPRRVEE